MNRVKYILIMFALAATSCTEHYKGTTDPEVDAKPITMVTAEIEPLNIEGFEESVQYLWQQSDRLGIYGSVQGTNSRYEIVSTTCGTVQGQFYGEPVAGELVGYFPYTSAGYESARAGRQHIPAEQKSYDSPLDHIYNNVCFVGEAEDAHFVLKYNMALLRIEIPFALNGIERVRLSVRNLNAGYDTDLTGDVSLDEHLTPLVENGSMSVVLNGVGGKDSSEQAPLVLWAVVAPGNYENMVANIYGDNWAYSKPVKGPFVVACGEVAECRILDENYDYGTGDFDYEPGTFN